LKGKKMKNTFITIKIRCSTKERLEKELADYIGKSGQRISLAEYIDRLGGALTTKDTKSTKKN